MKKVGLVFLILAAAIVFFIESDALFSQYVDFAQIADKWLLLMEGPDGPKALQVLEQLPANGRVAIPQDRRDLMQRIINDLGTLESELYYGDEAFTKLIFGLYCFTDDMLTANVNRLLGNLIAFKPDIFLRELSLKRDLVPSLEELLGSFKFKTAEDGTTPEVEKNLRIRALENVEDKELKDIRKECIKILKKL